jgi:hypothetical protein
LSRVRAGLALSFVVVCVGVFLAGGSDAAVLGSAREATLGEETARIEVEFATASEGTPPVRAAGVVDLGSGRGQLSLEGATAGPAEVRLVGPVAYIRAAGLELGNRPWVRIDLARAPSGHDLTALSGLDLAVNDPRRLLDLLAGAREVEKLGDAQVRGELTSRYRAEVDPAKAAEELEGAPRRAFESFSRRIGDDITVEVWVDEEGRARRIALHSPVDSAMSPEQSVSVDFFDFGAPADVEEPLESEVTIFGGASG